MNNPLKTLTKRGAPGPEHEEDTLEANIAKLVTHSRGQPDDYAPPPQQRLPDYVQQLEGAGQIGNLSAEAMVKEFEAAVQELAQLGTELMKSLANLAADVKGTVTEIQALAAQYRDRGKGLFDEIQQQSKINQDVRQQIGQMRSKLNNPETPPTA